MHYILFYEYVADAAEKRTPFRGEHLKLAKQAFDANDLVLAGAFAEPLDGAALVFRSAEAAEKFVQIDPYVKGGVVTSWRVRKWQTVIGDGAVPPAA
jgi:uncharacterized protein YciI